MNYSRVATFIGILIGLILVSFIYSNNLMYNDVISFESFLLINFLGYLFFLLMPVEAIFIFYLNNGYSVDVLLIAAIVTAVLGQIVDFLLGLLVSEKFARNLIGKKTYNNIKSKVQKYLSLCVFIFSLTFLPSSVMAFIAGVVKADYKRVFFYSFLGLTVKYFIIVGIFLLL